MKCAVITLGCKVNQCESESLARKMENLGYEIVEHNEKADVYIVNTCCVTAEGERKSRQAVRKARSLNPDAVIAVTGCAAQRAPEVFERIEGVTVVAGTKDKGKIPEMILEHTHLTRVYDIKDFSEYEELPDAAAEKTRAFIKIQDGCNNFCSYCIIPYVRGRERSRSIESIKGESERLKQKGFKEIVINGIHLSAYGKEWGFKPDLSDAVDAVCKTENISRVRLGSLEPNIITEDFLDKVTANENFCRQYHLSLQSGCDSVLKRMNRKYTTEQYARAVEFIRKNYPDSAISTDIIVGFPGETEEDFAETFEFARKIGFAWVHVFPYSVREGTVAAKMDGQIEKSEKARRAAMLSEICREKGREYRQRFVGKTKTVLAENNENGIQHGLTKEHIGVVFRSPDIENKIVKVKITAVTDEGLEGELLGE